MALILAAHTMLTAQNSALGLAHTFVYKATVPLTSISVAGTFNVWNKERDPMKLGPDGVTWTKTVSMPFGRNEYKFVLNGKTWIQDPLALASHDDGSGNVNSVILITPRDYNFPARMGDGVFSEDALFHESGIPWLNFDRGFLTFTLRCRPNDFESVNIRALGKSQLLQCVSVDDVFATYQGKMAWDGVRPISYDFEIRDGATIRFFGPSGVTTEPASKFTLNAISYKKFVTPKWVPGAVIYQIFPDRFANGSTKNDPIGVQSWLTGKPTYSNRFGGDIAGIRQHVNYLKQLGVNCLYLNPVFKSPSNHRYDASSYEQIDPEFGTNQEFSRLGKELQSNGIRTVLDLAFNHTAVDFPAFLDIRSKGPESKFTNWYFIKSYPVVVKENPPYEAWYGFPSMPKLNTMNPETTQYLLEVTDYWKRLIPGLSGFRLDAANEVDQRFWQLFRSHVKSADPQQWILGEEWGDARAWLKGDQWDSSMNYAFRGACVDFIAQRKGTATEFMNRLMSNYSMYPPQAARVMMNLLSSHDTARFLTDCGGDKEKQFLAADIQFTWIGAPSIYYGEELGMEGGKDPDNRAPMAWNLANSFNLTLAHYQKLIQIRRRSTALQMGNPVVLETSDDHDTLAYARVDAQDLAITVVNASHQPQKIFIPLDKIPASTIKGKRRFVDQLSGRGITASGLGLSITLKGMDAAILLPGSAAVFHSAKFPARRNLASTMHLSSHTAICGIKELSLS